MSKDDFYFWTLMKITSEIEIDTDIEYQKYELLTENEQNDIKRSQLIERIFNSALDIVYEITCFFWWKKSFLSLYFCLFLFAKIRANPKGLRRKSNKKYEYYIV